VKASSNFINWGHKLGKFSTNLPSVGGTDWIVIKGKGGVNGPVQKRLQKMNLKPTSLLLF
jgi:hypothetical protein